MKELVFREYSAELVTPLSAYQALCHPDDSSVLLESAESDPLLGRYSYMGFDPYLRFEGTLEELKAVLKESSCQAAPHQMGGGVGFLTYDAIRQFEKIPDRHKTESELPDILFLMHRKQLLFSNDKSIVVIGVVIDEGESKEAATSEIEAIYHKILHTHPEATQPFDSSSPPIPDVSDEAFCQLVEQAKKHITAGDIFQVVISRTFIKPYSGTPLDLYRSMRLATPAPCMFLINTPGTAFAGASPEKLVSVRSRVLETVPIAGTRPRGQGREDKELEVELLESEKEVAEHMMLVDLARNDLGIVSTPGTVEVKELKKPYRFSHVIHIVSKVQGLLAPHFHPLDALRALFPAGTLSGAPKIRAMQIIDELETSRRGLYGGAIFHIDASGDIESCIAIRMASLSQGIAKVRAGAGIVYDSNPLQEAQETTHKARGVLESLKLSGGTR